MNKNCSAVVCFGTHDGACIVYTRALVYRDLPFNLVAVVDSNARPQSKGQIIFKKIQDRARKKHESNEFVYLKRGKEYHPNPTHYEMQIGRKSRTNTNAQGVFNGILIIILY